MGKTARLAILFDRIFAITARSKALTDQGMGRAVSLVGSEKGADRDDRGAGRSGNSAIER